MLCTGIDLQRQTKPSWGRSHGNTISAKLKYVTQMHVNDYLFYGGKD
jgi:hypothetical protein